jgi:hypothetical protein
MEGETWTKMERETKQEMGNRTGRESGWWGWGEVKGGTESETAKTNQKERERNMVLGMSTPP